jgi:hypothetical protein
LFLTEIDSFRENLEILLVLIRFGQILMLVAMLGTVGAHWGALQTVAWTTMLADNLRTGSLKEAVSETFDGEHPCSLCKKIAEGKKSEKKADYSFSTQKFEYAIDRFTFIFSRPDQFSILPEYVLISRGLTLEPAVPPPRLLLG